VAPERGVAHGARYRRARTLRARLLNGRSGGTPSAGERTQQRDAMKRAADALFYILKVMAAFALAAMVVMVFVNVVLRYAFNEGIAVSEELSSWLLVWITYTAGLVALREHGHLGFDGVVAKMPPKLRRASLILAQLLMISVTYLFLSGSWQQTKINITATAPASGLSMGWLYGIGLVFSVGALAVLFADLYRLVTGKLDKDAALVKSEAGEALEEAKRVRLTEETPPASTPSTNRV
jgi:TRAP-type C4-dicarboxylate transport system permease small subunit